MTPLEFVRFLDGWNPIYYAGLSRKVRGGVTGWERWVCILCDAETLKGWHKEIQHETDCPWLSFPQIVAALEAAERFAKRSDPTMTPKRLAEIRERVSAATPGPWLSTQNMSNHRTADIVTDADVDFGKSFVMSVRSPVDEQPWCHWVAGNLEFVIAARTDLPDLLAEVDRLTAALEAVLRGEE